MSEHACTCEHPKQEPGYFCGPNCGPGNDIRHPKWQRVEPGTVIPAGQPFRIEYPGSPFDPIDHEGARADWVFQDFGPLSEWFVDSSWKPPLVLPTEPTWGIVIRRNKHGVIRAQSSERGRLSGPYFAGFKVEQILDFIPLTDEQVARIEAAR